MGLPTRPALVQSVELSAIGPAEEIAEGAAQEHRQAPLFEVPGAVVIEMAALAEGGEIAVVVVGRVLIKMGAGDAHQGGRDRQLQLIRPGIGQRSLADQPPAPVPPPLDLIVEPASVAEMIDGLVMGPAAMLASALGPAEADRGGEFAPVDRVEVAVLASDRHRGQPLLATLLARARGK